MTKDEIVKRLKNAQQAHIQWLACAEALISGTELEKEKIPLTYAECDFGRWYYGDGQCLLILSSFNALEKPHKTLHGFYHEIFTILYGETKQSFLSKLFGSEKKHTAEKYEQAKTLLLPLEQASNQMVRTLRLLEAEVMTMSDNKFAKLSCS